jgi:transposase
MHFKTKKTPTGQVVQLIESFRNPQGQPRDRIVASLGTAQIPSRHHKAISEIVRQRLYGETILFNDISESVQNWADYIVRLVERQGRWMSKSSAAAVTLSPLDKKLSVCEPASQTTIDGVLIDEVSHDNQRELGPSLVGLHAWNQLELGKELERLGLNSSQRTAAAITVINRLIDPVSEHGILPWLETTALPEILGTNADRPGDDRFYRASDLLLKNSQEIEHHIRKRQGALFNLDRTVLLYDLTNTHFEGCCESNPKAAYGKNKQGRNDCLQVVVGMVFDKDGFELAHKVFEGNRNDGKSLPEMVEEMERVVQKHDPQMIMQADKPLVIMDAGIANDKNLALLRDKGFSYLINDRRRGRVEFKDKFSEENEFTTIAGREGKPPVRVRLIELTQTNDDGTTRTERVVLCKSEPRAAKEIAMVSNAEERFLDNLKKLSKRISDGKLKDVQKVNRAVGRLQARHPGVQRHYTIDYVQQDASAIGCLNWNRNDDNTKDNNELCGCYVLRTDKDNLSADEFWRLYISLTRAEDGFRYLKSDLGLRPNFHQLEKRVDAHIFITILAYQLLCFIQRSLEQNGDNRSWSTIRRILQTHGYNTVVLPTKNGTVYRIRKAGTPDLRQRAIYETIGVKWIDLPCTRTVFDSKSEATL